MAVRVLAVLFWSARVSALSWKDQGSRNLDQQLATRDVDEGSILQRMQYWSAQEAALPSTGKYLLFTPDAGGLNNIRIGWEMTGAVARRTGRTLVLPPPTPMYLLDFGPWNKALVGDTRNWTRHTRVEDLINLQQLKGVLPTLTAEEFEAEVGMTWKEAKQSSQVASRHGDLSICHFADWEAVSDKFLLMDGDRTREGFMCGEWFLRGGPRTELRREMTSADWALLRHGFVWHPDAFDIAARVVRYLGLFEFVAAHIRYGDFAEKQSQRSPDDIFETLQPLINNATALYVATDRQDQFRGISERYNVRLIMWPDLFEESTGNLLVKVKARYTPERWYKLTGLVEEIICTYARVFVGTDRSSFSGHIERMRLHADAPVQMHLVHTDGSPFLGRGADREQRVPMAHIRQQIDEWERRQWTVAPITQGEQFVNVRKDQDGNLQLAAKPVPVAMRPQLLKEAQ